VLVDLHHLVDLADVKHVGSQGVVDAAYKDRHSSPRVVGATIGIAAEASRSALSSAARRLAEKKASLPRGEWLPWLEAAARGMDLSFHDERCEIRAWRFRRGRKMLARKIIAILFSLRRSGSRVVKEIA
jgi:hypothetical protein